MSELNGQVVESVKLVDGNIKTDAAIIEGMERIDSLRTTKQIKEVVKRVKLSEIDPRFDANNRNRVGSNLFGVTASVDTYDVPGIVEDIVSVGDILTPIDVFTLANGKLGVFKGRRRFLGAQHIATHMADSPIGKTMQTVPVRIHDITEDQANLLNNDQQSKSYLKSEVYLDFTRNLRAGADCVKLANINKVALTSAGFGHLRLAEMGNLSKEEYAAKMKNWYNGTVKGVLYNSSMCGEYVYNLYGQQLAYNDKIIAVAPPVDLTKSTAKSKRLNEAWNAVKADKDAGEHDFTTGQGPRLMALIEQWKGEDATPKTKAPRDGRKLKPAKDIQIFIDNNKGHGQTLVSAILDVAFEDNQGNALVFSVVNNMDKCMLSYRAYRDQLPPHLTILLDSVFSGSGAERFDDALANNCESDDIEVERIDEPATV